MSLPVITVGITAYREGSLLTRAWQSVLRQGDERWKCVVVVDGGADAETIAAFDGITDPRVSRIKLDHNIGPYPTREIFLAHCPDGIVLFLDADDYYAPGAFEAVRRLFSDPGVLWASGTVRMFWADEVGNVIRERDVPGRSMTPQEFVRKAMFPGLAVFRKTLFESTGGYDPALHRGKADFDFWLRVLELDVPSRHTDQILLHKQERSMSVSRSYNRRMHEVNHRIVENHPVTFQDVELRNEFLSRGYFVASRACVVSGDLKEAARLAKAGRALHRAHRYLCLPYADRLPHIVSRAALVWNPVVEWLRTHVAIRTRLRRVMSSVPLPGLTARRPKRVGGK